MENIWFYTLSTTAQVLAALAGLFAVFVVWKIQEFEKVLFENRTEVIKIVSHTSGNTKDFKRIEIDTLRSMSDLEILQKFSELLLIKNTEPHRINVSVIASGNFYGQYTLDKSTEEFYRNNITKKAGILGELKKNLILNLSVISACLFGLTFTNTICNQYILVIVCIAALYCLYSIGGSIYKITTI